MPCGNYRALFAKDAAHNPIVGSSSRALIQVKIHRPTNVRPWKNGFRSSSFDPPTLVVLEVAFDEAWLTLKSIVNTKVKPDELALSCDLRWKASAIRCDFMGHSTA